MQRVNLILNTFFILPNWFLKVINFPKREHIRDSYLDRQSAAFLKLIDVFGYKVDTENFSKIERLNSNLAKLEISINKTKEKMGQEVKAKAEKNAEEKILDILVSKTSSESTRESFRQKLRTGELSEKEVEIPVSANSSLGLPTMDIPGMPGSQMGMINLGDVFGKNFGK